MKIILEEGIESRIYRHLKNSLALRAGLTSLGLELVVEGDHSLPQVTPVWIPKGIDDAIVRTSLLQDYGIEIGRGLGEFAGRVWRIGLMGESSKPENIFALLSALEKILPNLGYEIAQGSGVAGASAFLAKSD